MKHGGNLHGIQHRTAALLGKETHDVSCHEIFDVPGQYEFEAVFTRRVKKSESRHQVVKHRLGPLRNFGRRYQPD